MKIKIDRKLGMEENFLKLIKDIKKAKPTANLMAKD